MTQRLLGALEVGVGLYFLLRYKSETHRWSEWARLNNWHVLFGGEPQARHPEYDWAFELITIVFGVGLLVLGILALIETRFPK